MVMLENLARRREENSQCLSRAKVRKASLPSMRSQLISWSGSVVAGRGEAHSTWGGWKNTTKNTWKKRDRASNYMLSTSPGVRDKGIRIYLA